MANYFQRSGYQVKTVASAEEALNSALAKEAPVLLLGSNLSESASLADLIHLLKTFDSTLHIVLVSEEMTLSETRRVREEGIFYQALKPAAADDTDELRQAVTCAFEDWADQGANLYGAPPLFLPSLPERSGP